MCDENKLIYDVIHNKFDDGVMIDVGADIGKTSEKFVLLKWDVIVFEPNPERHIYIENILKNTPWKKKYLTLEKKCVNDKEEDNLTFYISDVSKGISSLTNFHNSHKKASFTVSSVRLDNYMKSKNINHVNFLKIDAEGHDYFVLKSYPWDKDKPDVIECEFEDLKSVLHLNYSWKDMADFLTNLGYKIIISEWYPIVKYGTKHSWRKFKEYPCELDDKNAWGNFICFKDVKLYKEFKERNKKNF